MIEKLFCYNRFSEGDIGDCCGGGEGIQHQGLLARSHRLPGPPEHIETSLIFQREDITSNIEIYVPHSGETRLIEVQGND